MVRMRGNLMLAVAALVIAIAGVTVWRNHDKGGTAPTRLAIDDPQAAACVEHYPEDLGKQPVAFDGTVLEVKRGATDHPDPAEPAIPLTVIFQVNRVFKGYVGERSTMHTWDFEPSLPDRDVTGERYLVATGPTMDIMFCGFTRPYSEQDAAYWAETFQSARN